MDKKFRTAGLGWAGWSQSGVVDARDFASKPRQEAAFARCGDLVIVGLEICGFVEFVGSATRELPPLGPKRRGAVRLVDD